MNVHSEEVAMIKITKTPMRAASIALFAMLCLGTAPSRAAGDQAEQFTPEFRKVHTNYDVKHTPRIVAPDSVKRGDWFDVTVSVGAGGQHPSLQEHFVRYIALYKDDVEISRVYLHPVYSMPKVTFTIALDEGGTLRAVEAPTHSAEWITTKKIDVLP
jgi:superoxide reductase